MTRVSLDPFPGSDAVNAYIARFRRPDFPPLEFGEPLDLYPGQSAPTGFTALLNWKNSSWPHNERAGVYLIYSESLELIYVGTGERIGRRLYQWFGNGEVCVPRGTWNPSPRYLITIAVPKEISFEAPMLEAYLIGMLKPIGNTKGK